MAIDQSSLDFQRRGPERKYKFTFATYPESIYNNFDDHCINNFNIPHRYNSVSLQKSKSIQSAESTESAKWINENKINWWKSPTRNRCRHWKIKSWESYFYRRKNTFRWEDWGRKIKWGSCWKLTGVMGWG